MNQEEILKYLPILVTVISAIVAYAFGRLTEKKKQLTKMLEESIQAQYTKLYQEIITIGCIEENKASAIKEFISRVSNDKEVYKLFQEDINFLLFDLSVRIKREDINEQDLNSKFGELAKKVENEYWYRLHVCTKDLKWHINQNVMSKWISFPLNILFKLKDIMEYFSVTAVFILVVAIYDKTIPSKGGINLFADDIQDFMIGISCLIIILYIFIYMLYVLMADKRSSKKQRLFK